MISSFGKRTAKAKKPLSVPKSRWASLWRPGALRAANVPYGYDFVESERFNKRKHELYDLVVNEAKAAVVRITFDKYVHEGFEA